MDKSIEQKTGEPTNRATIQDTITKFIGLRNEFTSLENIAIQLNFGLERIGGYTPFDKVKNNLVYEPYITDELNLIKSHHTDKSRIVRRFPMVLEHKLLYTGRLGLILKQQFITIGEVDDRRKKRGILFDPKQKVSKKTGYYYRWTFKGDSVTISKMIGTTNVNQIKKQGQDLVRECQRFIFCYCQG